MLKKNNQFLTKKDLEKTLEKALVSQSRVILEAVDFGFRGVKKDIKEIRIDVVELKEDVAELKKNDKKFLAQQDKISKQLTDLQQESKMALELYKRHDRMIEGHEEIISKLRPQLESIL